MSLVDTLTISVAVASGIIIPVALAYRPQDIPFKLIRHDSSVDKPIESKTAIEVSHPDRTITKCRVIYKGHALLCDESNQPYVTVLAQGSALFRIPSNLEDNEAKIIVKNGRHVLRKEKLKDLERKPAPRRPKVGVAGFL